MAHVEYAKLFFFFFRFDNIFSLKSPLCNFGSCSSCPDCLNPFETTLGLVLPDNWEQFCNHPNKFWVQKDCQELIVSGIADQEGRQKTCDILKAGFLCEATISFSLFQRRPKSDGFRCHRLMTTWQLLSLSLLQSTMTPLCAECRARIHSPRLQFSLLFGLD